MRRTVIMLAVLSSPMASSAAEQAVSLADGPGRELVEGNCATCHSLDYIPMNSPFLDAKGWKAEVDKMMSAMGAPIEAKDAPAIVDYLVAHYGAQPKPGAGR